MSEDMQKGNESEQARLPEGFLFVNLCQVLYITAISILISSAIALNGYRYVYFILLPFAFILIVASMVLSRGVRKCLRENGDVEITFTMSYEKPKTRKSIFLRDVGELIDSGIDRILDGKEKDVDSKHNGVDEKD